MKLERVVDFGPDRVGLTFKHENLRLDKVMTTTHAAIGKRDEPAFLRSQFLYKAREADRDCAFMMFGDDWKRHAPSGGWKDYELSRLQLAAKQRPDLFGAAE